jgi:4-hydroxybenzoate polyprenyltransferase
MRRLALYLELVTFQHTLFALPFALAGALIGARGLPAPRVVGWVLVAMVGLRTAAMSFNRLVDRRFDAANPRTRARPLARGAVRAGEAWLLVAGGVAAFAVACAALNAWTLRLAPLALALTLGYSFTKRFTSLSHVVLGLALALAPLGGYVAASGHVAGFPGALMIAVLAWVAGFDTIYACQDEAFDRAQGLRSLPQRLGSARALAAARLFHLVALAALAATGWQAGLGAAYFVAVALAAGALVAQHALVSPRDLSRVQHAFFTLNAALALTVLVGALVAVLARG